MSNEQNSGDDSTTEFQRAKNIITVPFYFAIGGLGGVVGEGIINPDGDFTKGAIGAAALVVGLTGIGTILARSTINRWKSKSAPGPS